MNTLKIVFYVCVVIGLTSCNAALVSVAERTANWPSYSDQIPTEEKVESRRWAFVTTSLPSGHYRNRWFYPEKKQCTHMITFTDNSFETKDGDYREWWDDGFKKTEGQFINDKKIGLWKNYSLDTGELTEESEYKDGEISGLQKNYSKHGLSSTYTYVQGIKEGPFSVYDSTGIVINEGLFKADTIFQQSMVIEEKKIRTGGEKMPKFSGCPSSDDEDADIACAQRKMLEFIYSNIKYPADARQNDMEGTAIIRFWVDKDGSITHIQTARGLCRSIESECLRIVHAMPKWEPGIQFGNPVKVQFNLPIKFKLQ